ncbi:hypothetical protein A3C26_02205 [Candidatus Daviesbacteria bacterium RIFCSPHIGHO2_02_FULL_39_12]|uniref:Type II secretion system protein GspG C-terminal domain-containing protein n=2 Tax=Candidatus Daviesiibacteriota TaxID=1752718 RepID=A0A1F5JAE1_9BACT|nr:MAG: hypothetical protein A3C26_02205 [Candidatus Daviesbacteria bacterium RIFCSPHIGHO2_02_FULL_39_12]OGE71669.1 MAG: hypothetical protein A3H40_01515 [Candidatus Daviesbacteria bacterium RIFCSPLOWO2_02_FULL_38_15]
MRNDKYKLLGFTLVELLVVVAIIAVLSIIGMAAYGNVQKNARDAKRKGDIHIIRNALEEYYMDNKSYPITTEYSNTSTNDWTTIVGGAKYYASGKAPVDPINRESFHYIYYSIGKICARMLEIDEKSFCLKATQ